MTEYTPDVWVLLEITSKEHGTIRKILAGWYGGYCGSDAWQLSSGNLPEHMEGDFIVFPQESGSVYRCHKDCQKLSGYTRSILTNFQDKAATLGAYVTTIDYKIQT